MAGELTIEVNTDGSATINFPGGGIQTVTGANAVQSLQNAYGDRIGKVVQSSTSSSQQANNAFSVRDAQRVYTENQTASGAGVAWAGTANEDGYNEADIQRYIDSTANKLGPGYESVEEYINDNLSTMERLLVDKGNGGSSSYAVFSEEEWSNLTTKQKLAANELFYQGSGDTPQRGGNGLSQKDIDWIKNEANDFNGVVTSANGQAISTGRDAVIRRKPASTGGGTTAPTDTGAGTGTGTGTVITGGGTTDTGGNITGGDTGTDTYTGPNFVSTPNIGNITPVYGEGQTGLTEVDIPTYEVGLGLQQTQFENRATQMEQFYQPQTQAEKEAKAASDPTYTAPAFENVMYRNRFGMTMYIQHINGVPSQPIPPGYFRVENFTDQSQTQVGSAAQGQNQGGIIQGFSNGATVNPALNYKPGGTVVEENGLYRIKYPDGTYSQNYDTAMNARAANQQGLAGLGLPDYTTYLSNQGIDMNLPGYDEAAYRDAYSSYITDPATLTALQQQQQQEQEESESLTGNVNADQPTAETEVTLEDLQQSQRDLASQAYSAPGGAVAASPVSYIDQNAYGSVIESTAGQALGTAPMVQEEQVAQIGSATTADTPAKTGAGQVTANQAYDDVSQAVSGGTTTDYQGMADAVGATWDAETGQFLVTDPISNLSLTFTPEEFAKNYGLNIGDYMTTTGGMTAVTSTGPTKTIDAAQQTGTSVSTLDAATGESVDVTAPDARTLETIDGQSELITGTGVDQSKVLAAFGEGEIKAASVQDELTGLMKQFEGGNTPAWAAGSMRSAMATLAARGLGASSMAGQAVIQAAMEAALPIAQIDASNKQQMALFKGEQRAKFLQMEFDQAFQAKVINAAKVSEIANMNFTAEQQIALENSKAANTMALENLSNSQALIMAEAAALSQLDMANLSNRQQAAIQNAQNFLQIDMANLANEQQTALFKQQSLINTILSDQAAANAAAQFNATSQNQTDQFFANLSASVNQFNAAQQNAMKQFNADEVNSLLEFNAGLQNQREMFNAQNYLVVAQANAQWRQNLATINTAAANESNMEYAQTVNALTLKSLDEIWQRERDLMDYSFTQSENAADRALSILLGDKQLSAVQQQIDSQEDQALGTLLTKVFFSSDFKSIFSPDDE
jgi:hypothetical protein